MTVKLSSKGRIALPKQVRMQLRLRPGVRFVCDVEGKSIILTLEPRPTVIVDPATGLRITKSPPEVNVTSEDVRAALTGFP